MNVKERAAAAQEPEEGIGLPIEQVRALWKHRWIILSVIAVAVCVDALWVLRQPKIYAASVSVQFEPNPPRPLGRQVEEVDSAGITSYWNIREYYETQYKVAKSRSVAEGVVRQLGLHHDSDFMGIPPQRRASWHSATVSDAANLLISRTRVDPVKDSRLMTITIEDQSPRRAQLLANTLAEVYIRRNLDHRLGSTREAVRWLNNQLDELRENLNRSENNLQEFRRTNNIVSDSFSDQRNIVGNRIARLSEALTDIQARRITLAARVNELQRASTAVRQALPTVSRAEEGVARPPDFYARLMQALSSLTAPELVASTMLGNLRTQLESALREEEALAPVYLPNHDQMRVARARTNEIVTAMRAEVETIRGAAVAELAGLTRAEGGIRAELTSTEHQAVELNRLQMRYQQLNRERENHAKIYGIVLERTTEGSLMQDLQVNNMSILDFALVPTSPIKPRVAFSLMVGAVIGLILGIFVAFLAIQADRTVRSRVDIEELLNATFLGYMPYISDRGLKNQYRYQYSDTQTPATPVENRDMVVHSHPSSMVAELARGIRTNLLFMSPDQPFHSLMVTSAAPREGKTFTAVSLAITLAQSGKRVLLVDGDLRRPRVHKVFRMHPPVGLTSLLVGEATLDEVAVDTEVPNLQVLPCGPIPPNPSELLHSQRATDVINLLRQRYDRVVWDSPPVTAVTDALVLGPQLDGVVLVCRARQTRRDQVSVVVRQLRTLGSKLVGVVLNAVDLQEEVPAAYYGKYDYSSHRNEQPAPNAQG